MNSSTFFQFSGVNLLDSLASFSLNTFLDPLSFLGVFPKPSVLPFGGSTGVSGFSSFGFSSFSSSFTSSLGRNLSMSGFNLFTILRVITCIASFSE